MVKLFQIEISQKNPLKLPNPISYYLVSFPPINTQANNWKMAK